MKPSFLSKALGFFLIAPFVLGGCQSPKNSDIQTATWTPLFNGTDLTGWTPKIKGFEAGDNYANTFRVEDGILKINYDAYDRYGDKFGALYTNEAYEDYRLRVEYRFVGDTATGAPVWGFRDSGIQFHGQSATEMGLEQNFPVCLEMNLHGGDGENERPNGQICCIGTQVDIEGKVNPAFCNMPTVKRTFHGDQWVTLEINVQGDTISQWLNGEKVLEFTNPRYNAENEQAQALIKDGKGALRSGHISLQSNSHPIEFRKIEIKIFD